MSTQVLIAMSVASANVLGAGMIVPQVAKLRRQRSTAGLSAAWVGIGFAMNLWWLAYGVSQQLWGMLPVSIGAAALYAVIVGQMHAIDGPHVLRGAVRGAILIAVGPLLFLLIGGWSAAGLAIGLIYAIQFGPAAIAAMRTNDAAGIATATWVMALGEALIWFCYGWYEGDVALVVGGTGGAIMSAVILVRLAWLGSNSADQRESTATKKSDSLVKA